MEWRQKWAGRLALELKRPQSRSNVDYDRLMTWSTLIYKSGILENEAAQSWQERMEFVVDERAMTDISVLHEFYSIERDTFQQLCADISKWSR